MFELISISSLFEFLLEVSQTQLVDWQDEVRVDSNLLAAEVGAGGVRLMAGVAVAYSLAAILAFPVAKVAYYCHPLGQKKWQGVFLQYQSPG